MMLSPTHDDIWEAGKQTAGENPLISRRVAVGGALGIATMIAIGGFSKAFAGSKDFLRPPGGQDYDTFIGACIKCDRCRSACPRGAISVCTISDGIVNARLPQMNFRLGSCDMCEGEYKCIAACQTGALTVFDSARDKMGLPVIDKSECLLYGTSGECDARCIDSCKWEALSLDGDGRLVLDEDKCNGCGACEYVCPSASYGSYSGSGRRGINIECVGTRAEGSVSYG
jgi:ferredoxin-type protein NapG